MTEFPLKQCTKCKSNKDPNEFGKNKRTKDGLHNECKACLTKRYREYYSRPGVKEKRSAYMRDRFSRPEVKKKVAEYQRKYYSRPGAKAKLSEYQREWYSRP